MKTSKLLMAYGLEVEVSIRPGSDISLASIFSSGYFSVLGLRPDERQIHGKMARIKAATAGYPVLLAVLAEKC